MKQPTSSASPSKLSSGSRILIRARSKSDAWEQAQKYAGSIGKPLQRIDLSSVVSEYLRETEKRLLALLDTAEESGAVLFFDEADALFGKRSSEKASAKPNLDVPFFRQCIENFPGSVIISTQSREALDEESLRGLGFRDKN